LEEFEDRSRCSDIGFVLLCILRWIISQILSGESADMAKPEEVKSGNTMGNRPTPADAFEVEPLELAALSITTDHAPKKASITVAVVLFGDDILLAGSAVRVAILTEPVEKNADIFGPSDAIGMEADSLAVLSTTNNHVIVLRAFVDTVIVAVNCSDLDNIANCNSIFILDG